MASTYQTIEALRDFLAQKLEPKTCRIGVEAGLSPDDAPYIRLEPISQQPQGAYPFEALEVLVIFGRDISQSDSSMEDVVSAMMADRDAIFEACTSGDLPAHYITTEYDRGYGKGIGLKELAITLRLPVA